MKNLFLSRPIYLRSKKYKINNLASLAFLISYYMFFGVQNALWSDVHSLTFGVAFLTFFIYFLDSRKKWPTLLFFALALISKEDIGFLTFFIAFVYFLWRLYERYSFLRILHKLLAGFVQHDTDMES